MGQRSEAEIWLPSSFHCYLFNLLEWPDEATKTAAWSAFMADTEWSEIKRVTHAEHGLMVGQIEDRLLVPVDYSPVKGGLLQTA